MLLLLLAFSPRTPGDQPGNICEGPDAVRYLYSVFKEQQFSRNSKYFLKLIKNYLQIKKYTPLYKPNN